MDTFSKIAAYLSGTCNVQEKKALEAWRRENPANEQEFCRLEKVWKASAQPACFMPDIEHAWQKVSSRIGVQESSNLQAKAMKPAPFFGHPWRMAAAVALLLLGSAVFLFLKLQDPGPGSSNSARLAGLSSIQTTDNKQEAVELADGTRVWLNGNSSLHYPENFSDSLREIHLQGEAYFEVAHQPDKPFVIRAGDASVKVLGTSFNLNNREAINLQVISGRVEFMANQENEQASLLLEAGQAARFKEGKLRQSKPNQNALAWKTGHFVFDDSSLEEVFAALETYYPVKFQAAEEHLWKCRLYTKFEQESLEEVLNILSLTLNLQFEQQKEKKLIIFSADGKGCRPIN